MPQNLPITPAEDAAQDWLLRLASGDASQADLNGFKAWRDADPSHRLAFEEVRNLWNDIGSLEAAFTTPPANVTESSAEVVSGAQTSPGVIQLYGRRTPPQRTGLRVALGGLVAACILLVGVFSWDIPTAFMADFQTKVGEQANMVLPDGSSAHLNTDSAIAIDFTKDRRSIILLKGEALFEVQKDPNRPFNVKTLEGSSTAIGTVYSVQHTGDDAIVTVIEGRVRVSSPSPNTPINMTTAPHVELDANQQVRYRRGAPPGPIARVNADQTAAWRRGLVLINAVSFADAISEIDRYRPGRILVLGESTQIEPVTARIALQEIDGGLKALAALNGLSVTQFTDYLTILH